MQSTFTSRVEKIVRGIKKGKTMTYGQVAALAGRQGAARAVGNIMSRNKDKTIPCHRVIRADGTLGAYNKLQGSSKRRLLQKEGAL